MVEIPGFKISQTLYDGAKSLVYQGIRESDGTAVVIKLLREDYPSADQLARFRREYEILSSLKGAETVDAYALMPYAKSLIIIMSNFGNCSMMQLLKSRLLTLDQFLQLALNMTEALATIHNRGIIHKDINPGNIMVEMSTLRVKIIDFGISSTLRREEPEIENLQVFEGMLPYVSPEQTGRMNRGIDYRTDYYSLGVIFYQMVTGRLPFITEDSLEMIHCHIAKIPQAPHQVNPLVPQIVSMIILKLMAKTAEDRYQSTFGIKDDLEQCLQQWQSSHEIATFPIAMHDVSERFNIPEKLYGREAETWQLMDAFTRISTGAAELMMVSGYAGVGKSRLVHEIHKPIVQKRGYFISGKFDQFKRDRPYISLIQAFQELIQQILTTNDAEINGWRERITLALGDNAQVVVEVIPQLTAIIGAQPEVPKLGATETLYRFHIVFQNFVQSLTTKEHPLVIFLDDLQWADRSSLKLLETLLGNMDSRYFLIIGAYRDNEITPAHPLPTTLETIAKAGLQITTLELNPLNFDHIERMLIDTLHSETQKLWDLINICFEKTHGNPFFLTQFLQHLYHEELISFDAKKGKWIWDIQLIQQTGYTDNVAEFMTQKISRLLPHTQEVLQLAACLGNRFDLHTLTVISQKSATETANDLQQALQEGLVLPVNDAYKYVGEVATQNATYQFLHDRVQHAAYSSIAEQQLAAIHLKIGRLLLHDTATAKTSEMDFEIVNHLNQGVSLVDDASEREMIAQLNLNAGLTAKLSAAYQPALNYLKTGIVLLEEDSWSNAYALTLALHIEAVESAYLAAAFEEMEQFTTMVLQRAVNLLDKNRVYEIKIAYFARQNQFSEAIHLGLEVLKLFGIHLDEKPTMVTLAAALLRHKLRLIGKDIKYLYNIPPMADLYWQTATRLVTSITASAYLSCPNLLALLALKLIELTLAHGTAKESTYGYVLYGILLCGKLYSPAEGYKFGQLTSNLLEKLQVGKQGAWMLLPFYCFISHWQKPLNQSQQPLVNIFEQCIDVGSLEYAGYTISTYIFCIFLCGKELSSFSDEAEKYAHYLTKIGEKTSINYVNIFWRAALILKGYTHDAIKAKGASFDDNDMVKLLTANQDNAALCMFYVSKIMVSYILGDYQQAYHCVKPVTFYASQVIAAMFIPHCSIYAALTCLQYYSNVTGKERSRLRKRIRAALRELKRWAHYVPANYLHKYYIVKAEYARVRGEYEIAAKLFDEAITLAANHDYPQEEAMANELAAKFYLSLGKSKIAKTYMYDAYYGYSMWGATAKTLQLEVAYPQFLLRRLSPATLVQATTINVQSGTSSTAADYFDLSTIMKSTQAISKQIVLSDLMREMMRIVIENAGAQKGYLLLEKDGEWFIEAEGSTDAPPKVMHSLKLGDQLPRSIISYVIHSKSPVLLDDAAHENQFSADVHLIDKRPKSVLCMPLLSQQRLIGILYLENNLTTRTFTQNRLELLNLLSGQIVISMDNAQLYTDTITLNKNLSELNRSLSDTNKAYARFVPQEFLSLLGRKSITEVALGDQIQQEMTILFMDVRNFTTLSEKMAPSENFAFINNLLGKMEPVIANHHGLVDKYLGDGIMALFPTNADDALQAALGMSRALLLFNAERRQHGMDDIRIGLGLNSGLLMLGTVGGKNRMDTTVIADAVNLASRVETLTKIYSVSILITEATFDKLTNVEQYSNRKIGTVFVKGKTKPVTVYEIFDTDLPHLQKLKLQTKAEFENGINLYHAEQFDLALQCFKRVLEINSEDLPAVYLYHKCEEALNQNLN